MAKVGKQAARLSDYIIEQVIKVKGQLKIIVNLQSLKKIERCKNSDR